ncbi:uncharacterized protein LOC105424065 [Pogonomyrmex barbatus]|uniref:Uncharacterized protein LOC105424065 n=1 Tax=Pogonomyrmex barbatus TaxID=144034 RepID=A0A6I9VYW7_9HYME|nr:uncharacterized protein LOC105424065 [Pogonomyrmex barbatus]
MTCEYGNLTYRLSQLLTDHGCFSVYLCRIRKYFSEGCEHCEFGRDDASHTLARCEAWSFLRELCKIVGRTLTDDSVIPIMLSREENWELVASFAEEVMLKEESERARQAISSPG